MADTIARLTESLADRYAVERELGAGGMATVYLARDLRHSRPVALKVLRPELAAILGAERFLKEIQLTANLQHPHILPLHDSGEAGGSVFYVMPFVEGESLRDRLAREHQLPVEDAVRIAREVADALEYAHQQGVIHRDIKPENILLHGGHALVADFGIALAASRTDGSTRMTETGMSLGTPAYMAPEQAMGERDITPKADIYALGAVLYEMLSGEAPFVGPTAQAIIARVMTEEPRALSLHRHTIPAHLEAAVRKALEKLPADRFARAVEFADALAAGAAAPAVFPLPVGAPVFRAETAAESRRRLRRYAMLAGLVALSAAVGALAWKLIGPAPARPSPRPVARFSIALPDSISFVGATGATIAMAPDGSRIAYIGRSGNGSQLYLRSLDRFEPVPIPGTEAAALPFFSPDGLWIAFRQGSHLAKVALAGGSVQPITDVAGEPYGASWGTNDTIVFSDGRSLLAVPAAGGRPTVLATPDSGRKEVFLWPDVLPDGRAVLFTVFDSNQAHLGVLVRRTGEIKRLQQTGGYPRYVDGGFVALNDATGSTGQVVAVRFDTDKLDVVGSAMPIATETGIVPSGDANLGLSRTGDLAYQWDGGAPNSVRRLSLVSRSGEVQDLGAEPGPYYGPRLSPDGRQIAITVAPRNSASDVWVYDLRQHTRTRVTFDTTSERPVWSPDGRRIAYTRWRNGTSQLLWLALDGSPAESLVTVPGAWFAGDFTPGSRGLVMQSTPAGRQRRQLSSLMLDSTRTPQDFVAAPGYGAWSPSLSPDGRWVAYASNESGTDQIYVRSFPGPGARWQVSVDGGIEPLWSRNGREIFYRSGNRMMAATVRTTPAFEVVSRTVLFDKPFAGDGIRGYDVSADGRSFVMLQGVQEAQRQQAQMVVVLNWFDQLRQTGRAR